MKRYLNAWNLIGLALLPSLYWGLDLAWHALFSESQLLVWANLVLPFAVSAAAFGCLKIWKEKLAQCASPALYALLGIYLSGPTYLVLQAWVFGGHAKAPEGETFRFWLLATACFPFTTFDLSAYDITLPAPFLTCLGIWLARLKATRSMPLALSKSA